VLAQKSLPVKISVLYSAWSLMFVVGVSEELAKKLVQFGSHLVMVFTVVTLCPFNEGKDFFGKDFLADRARIPGVHKNRECLDETRSVFGLDEAAILYAGKGVKNKGLEDKMIPCRKVVG
jgi:hypothetical protein